MSREKWVKPDFEILEFVKTEGRGKENTIQQESYQENEEGGGLTFYTGVFSHGPS